MARSAAARKSFVPRQPAKTPVQSANITDVVETGGVPPSQGNVIPGIPPIKSKIKTNLLQQYVSRGAYTQLVNYAEALPRAIDDLSAQLGSDIYDQMMLDPQVSSMINVLRASVLEDGLTFQPAITEEEDPQHDAAVTMADWCTKVFKRLRPSMDVTLYDMTEAFAQGNRVAELVWEVAPDPHTKRPALLLKAIKPKPRECVSFVVDAYSNLLGILAVEVGRAYPIQSNIYVMDLSSIPNLLVREKFCILTFREHDGDPRGTTPLRQAYDAWWLAKQSRSLYLAYIAQFAGPSIVGITPEGAESDTEDANGNPLDPSLIVTPETAQAAVLETLRSGSVVSLPFGSQANALEVKGDGTTFENFEDRQDKRIAMAILNNTLSVMEGQHQTQASSGTHQDVTDTIVRQIRGTVEQMIADQVVRLLVQFNFGEDALDLAPVPMLGRVEQHDFSSMAGGVAALQSSGYLGGSQKPGIDELLGLPVRDVEADALAAATALATAQAMAAADPNNPANAGAVRTEGKEAAGGQVSSDQAQGEQTAQAAKGSKPDKPQPNPGAQSGVEQEGKE